MYVYDMNKVRSDFASDSDLRLRLVCCNVNIFNPFNAGTLFFIIFNIFIHFPPLQCNVINVIVCNVFKQYKYIHF